MKPYLKRAWAEISLPKLRKNVEIIRSLNSAGTEIMAVVKADAYGHGDEHIVRCLAEQCGIKYFAVSNLDEAIAVRKFAPDADILILGYTPPEYAHEIASYNIIQGVVSTEYAQELVKNTPAPIRCHIKIDTGMGRIGLKHDTPEACAAEIEAMMKIDKLSVEGIYTHFAVADSDDPDNIAYTDKQEKFITDTYDVLVSHGIKLKHLHFMNSAATCYRNSSRSTLSRAGIILYGLHPDVSLDIPDGLEPLMELKAVISHVKTVNVGDCISYGRTFVADHEMRIATVTIGYADGYSRLLSSKGEMLVHGKRCKIVGRVCMDQLMIDVSDVPEAKSGDIVILIGEENGERITADDLAQIYGTIGYEVVCGISKRVPRIYIE
ncbi:alanine racemase [Ruminococcus flavefaciens]|uniref:Alanine racemase n=1 Tax=Ruminococcus flavefaciens TaxID=1265 RepID=A0A1H6K5U5_RUMFL|nr:alanine racemase [Ruminococcus flavefaciens]SEH67756.1 alanine racemase [Ruminococcus flavefaciens]